MTTQVEMKCLQGLRGNQLTQTLSEEHLHKLASASREMMFSKGEIIYNIGEPGQAIYIIIDGQVIIKMETSRNQFVTTQTLGPNELFGWSSLFQGVHKAARARALADTNVIAIDAALVREAWQSDPEFETAIVRLVSSVMTDRIRSTRRI